MFDIIDATGSVYKNVTINKGATILSLGKVVIEDNVL